MRFFRFARFLSSFAVAVLLFLSIFSAHAEQCDPSTDTAVSLDLVARSQAAPPQLVSTAFATALSIEEVGC